MDTLDEYFRSVVNTKKLEDMIFAYGTQRTIEHSHIVRCSSTSTKKSEMMLDEILEFVGKV